MDQISTMSPDAIRRLSDQATKVLLNKPNTASSTQGGWMMIATILIEAWDLYAIAFVLIFVKTDFNPTAFELGLATAAVQGGALVGAQLGGILADRFGRKAIFVTTMILFIILALAQAFARDIWDLIILRFLIGIPLGSDISNGYAYIMESMSKGKREEMGSRWQFMFGVGEVLSIIVITIMYVAGMDHSLLWRVALALGALPAVILLVGRLNLPETPLSLLQRGQFVKAKQVSKQLFNDSLDMLPNQNVRLPKAKLSDFLSVIWADPIKRRATIFSWISNACQGAEFAAWGFYLPVVLVLSGVGVSNNGNITGTNLVTALVFCLATVSGYVAPLMLSKIGHRGVSMWGYGLAFAGLIMGAIGMYYDWKFVIVIGACVLMWGHYWDASNGMTITSMVAPARFRGTASGFGYLFVKGAAFFGAFVFPILSQNLGNVGATLAVSLLSLTGFLAAKFILPEVYGYVDTEDVT
ncbi:MFS transporter [Methylovirgula sp. 4M-Z18]|uniref:MFS transporter n=1 Tax=Methylovirgula sp. 4M-Z18 TaxID=2293567 RepID=UPI000E2E736A|nr:MFS transporter [Methylovirgula sp. 4M-Z18]RFB80921.1 MFS transporter [Methylovirgula sp. 4M-Z18]